MNPFQHIVTASDKLTYTTVERLVEMIFREYKFITKINYSDVIEWVGNMYGIINYPGMYRIKITGTDPWTPNIAISQYRGELPSDYVKVLKAGVRNYDTKEIYRESTGTYTTFLHDRNEGPEYTLSSKVYSIKGGYIFLEEESATIELAYTAFPIDERGYPLIPDNEQFLQYAVNFIAEKITFNLFAAGKISGEVYDIVNRKRLWSVGAAHTSLINPSPEKMEAWTRSRLKLMPRVNSHEMGFAINGEREDLALGTNLY